MAKTKGKKIILGLLVIACIILLFLIKFILLNNLAMREIEKFKSFSSNNVLLKKECSFKINENLPKIEAASAFYPFGANMVQNIYDENSYSDEILQMVSTSEAFKDIVNGKTDIVIATAPSDDQKEEINKAGVELEFKQIYLEPLVIYLNKNNGIENLTIEQIQKIYYNDNLEWNEFGGIIGNIHTYQLEKNNGSQTCFETIVKNNSTEKNHYEIKTMPKIIDEVAEDNYGIGYAFDSYFSKMHTNDKVKKIKINGKIYNEQDYPLLFEVYLIYRKDNKNDNISKIIEWLETEEGKQFILLAK